MLRLCRSSLAGLLLISWLAGPAWSAPTSQSERIRAIKEVERDLQKSSASRQRRLFSRSQAPASPSRSASPSKPAAQPAEKKKLGDVLGKLFGKSRAREEGGDSSVASSRARPSSNLRPTSGRGSDEVAAIELDQPPSTGQPVSAPSEPKESPLRRLVGSVLQRMGTPEPMATDGDFLNAGGQSFDDFVRRERTLNGVPTSASDPPGTRTLALLSGKQTEAEDDAEDRDRVSSNRLLAEAALSRPPDLPVSQEVKTGGMIGRSEPATVSERTVAILGGAAHAGDLEPQDSRATSNRLLAQAAASRLPDHLDLTGETMLAREEKEEAPGDPAKGSRAMVSGSPATGSEEKEAERGVGTSSTYEKALAKLEAYRQPSPPLLREVSGFPGLLQAKPSEQSPANERTGVLSMMRQVEAE